MSEPSPREELLALVRHCLSLQPQDLRLNGPEKAPLLRALEVLANEHPYGDFGLSDYEALFSKALSILRGER